MKPRITDKKNKNIIDLFTVFGKILYSSKPPTKKDVDYLWNNKERLLTALEDLKRIERKTKMSLALLDGVLKCKRDEHYELLRELKDVLLERDKALVKGLRLKGRKP